MFDSYSCNPKQSISINAVNGAILKNHPKSWFERFHYAKLHQKETHKALQDEKALRLNEDFIKAEAYKEFAKKVSEEITDIRRKAPGRHITVIVETLLQLQQRINNILKELEGENNG